MKNTRAMAAKVLQQVIEEKQSLTSSLPTALKQCSQSSDRALIQSLCFGVLRWYFQLKPIAEKLLFSPLKPNDQDVFCLLLIGVYQLTHSDIPTYAAVSAAVEAARGLRKPWACGLLNKVLRIYSSKKEDFLAQVSQNSSARYAHPTWFIEEIQKSWPDHWQTILAANNDHPPMVLRVNSQKTTRDEYLNLLHQHQIEAVALDLPQAIQLTHPVAVTELPGFSEGLCYVQDASGQYAATLLDLEKNLMVLDACAAPGSKTTHILELQPQLKKLVAIEYDASRLTLIKENIARLGLINSTTEIISADAGETEQWSHGQKFDRILLDAPCSATGIIRRHPDIKVLRQKEDIPQYQQKQTYLLNALWSLLNPQGILLYSTCSIFPAENENIISEFLSTHTDAEIIPLNIPQAIPCRYGQQILPAIQGMDGFYYLKLKKRSI